MTEPYAPSQTSNTEGDPDPLARIGEVVDGRYRLLEFIGQGGMGNVYRGEHVTIRKPVALKLLHPSLANIPEIRSRFEREAFAIGRIDHPNCVEVSDFGELGDGSLFLTMEYLSGESAADLLDHERPVAPAKALQIVRHVLAGLAHAHRVGIVHRDVKPENIFIVPFGGDPTFAKILDFGIAKLLDDAAPTGTSEKLTQAGITFGTPAYLSPEQALGDPADRRSDLYSVAVVLYELLTGLPPFRSDDKMELLAMHATRPPPALSDDAPQIEFPDGLEALVARGLSKRPDDRYQSAEEFVAAIDEIGLFPRPSSASDGTLGTAATAFAVTPLPGANPPAERLETEIVSRRSWVPKLALGLIAVGCIAGIIMYAGSRVRTLSAIERDEPSDVAKEAEEKLAVGANDEAIEVVENDPRTHNDASAQLRLGHAYANRADYAEALTAYGRALNLEPNEIRDPDLITNLRLMIDKSGPVYFDAISLLLQFAKDEEAENRLIALASSSNLKQRDLAAELAKKFELDERIDRVQAALWDLTQRPTCAERLDAVGTLRSLKDKRAIKALKAASYRRKSKRSKANVNKCLSQAARDAARFLESQPDPEPDDKLLTP